MKPISKTAFYCCGVRMQDAQSPNPVCGDNFAHLFMDEAGLKLFDSFKSEKKANAGNVARARIIDDYLREELAANPDALVVTLGAGFDSRPYRQKAGHWLEVDEPQVIAYKNERLPIADCPNPLTRLSIDFSAESLADKLAPFAGGKTVIFVVEGVLLYLDPPACESLVRVLRELFPHHKLVCDLMTRKFLDSYARAIQSRISDIGASLTAVDKPESFFEGRGYRLQWVRSIFRRGIELGSIRIPKFMLHFMRTLENGYSIFLFEM